MERHILGEPRELSVARRGVVLGVGDLSLDKPPGAIPRLGQIGQRDEVFHIMTKSLVGLLPFGHALEVGRTPDVDAMGLQLPRPCRNLGTAAVCVRDTIPRGLRERVDGRDAQDLGHLLGKLGPFGLTLLQG